MSSQAGTFPVSAGHPESWTLRKDSVNNSSVCEISENENWMNRSEGSCGGDEASVKFSRGLGGQAGRLDSKPASLCLQEPHPAEAVGTGDGGSRKKRHMSVSHQGNHRPVARKRRKTVERSSAQPKFLMGGSIQDPLNLNSLCDEEVSRCLNAATPISSPLPHLNKDPNPVIVPADVRDPLQLNVMAGQEASEGAPTSLTRTLTPKAGGKKRKKRPDKLAESSSHSADEAGGVAMASTASTLSSGKPVSLNLDAAALRLAQHSTGAKIPDKIVSPVLPADSSSGGGGQAYRKRKKQCEPTAKISRALLVDGPQEPGAVSSDSPDKKPRDRTTPEKRRYKRQTSRESRAQPPKFREQDKKFQYGNYHRYYGYRNPEREDDARIPFLRRKWFEGRTCLDIGCNSGHVTLYVAKNFAPERMTGIDIDGTLIGIARKNIRHCLAEEGRGAQTQAFPASMEKLYGPISSSAQPTPTATTSTSKFPGNILFRCANFVPESDQALELQKPEYDTVLCLSVTKWVQLNWGDAGLKRLFRRIYLALRPGGRLILEPQGWPSYTKKKKLTETIYKNFKQIQLKPDKFKDYLLSSHVGFSSCETIGTPLNKSKGFRRPIFMFTKLTPSREGCTSRERSDNLASADQKSSSSGGRPSRPRATDPHREAVPAEHRSNPRGLDRRPSTAPFRPRRDVGCREPARKPGEAPHPPPPSKPTQAGPEEPRGRLAETPRPSHPRQRSKVGRGETEIASRQDKKDPQGSRDDALLVRDDDNLQSRVDERRINDDDLKVKDDDCGNKDDDLKVKDDDCGNKDDDLKFNNDDSEIRDVKDDDLKVKDDDLHDKDDDPHNKDDDDLKVKDDDLKLTNDDLRVEDYDLQVRDDPQVKDDDLCIKDDDHKVKEDDFRIKDDDHQVKDDDHLIKDDDHQVKDDGLKVKEDNPQVKGDNIQVKDDDPQSQDDDFPPAKKLKIEPE